MQGDNPNVANPQDQAAIRDNFSRMVEGVRPSTHSGSGMSSVAESARIVRSTGALAFQHPESQVPSPAGIITFSSMPGLQREAANTPGYPTTSDQFRDVQAAGTPQLPMTGPFLQAAGTPQPPMTGPVLQDQAPATSTLPLSASFLEGRAPERRPLSPSRVVEGPRPSQLQSQPASSSASLALQAAPSSRSMPATSTALYAPVALQPTPALRSMPAIPSSLAPVGPPIVEGPAPSRFRSLPPTRGPRGTSPSPAALSAVPASRGRMDQVQDLPTRMRTLSPLPASRIRRLDSGPTMIQTLGPAQLQTAAEGQDSYSMPLTQVFPSRSASPMTPSRWPSSQGIDQLPPTNLDVPMTGGPPLSSTALEDSLQASGRQYQTSLERGPSGFLLPGTAPETVRFSPAPFPSHRLETANEGPQQPLSGSTLPPASNLGEPWGQWHSKLGYDGWDYDREPLKRGWISQEKVDVLHDGFPVIFTTVCAVAFLMPFLTTVHVGYDRDVAFWVGGEWWSLALVLPFLLIVAYFVHRKARRPVKMVVLACTIIPSVLFLLISDHTVRVTADVGDELFSLDCRVNSEKGALQRSWEAAEALYDKCMMETVQSAGGASSNLTLAKAMQLYRVQDCEEYSREAAKHEHWEYLWYLEENHGCSGWCFPSKRLWTYQAVRDPCRIAVSQVLTKKANRSATQVCVLCILSLVIFSVLLIAAGPVLQSHGIEW